MLILAIDTSDRHFSVALLQDTETVLDFDSSTFPAPTEASDPENQFSNVAGVSPTPNQHQNNKFPPGVSVRLFPMLERLFKDAKIAPRNLDLIGLTAGPGSFTGIRVGVVTAKTLAYANQIPLVGVNTLEVIARQSAVTFPSNTDTAFTICPVINAQRQQLFCGSYEWTENDSSNHGSTKNTSTANGVIVETAPNRIVDRAHWLKAVVSASDARPVIVTGIGLNPILADVKQLPRFGSGDIRIAPESAWAATAAVTGRLALEKFLADPTDELWTLEPFYFRPSYAEED